ncbi:hypothetical protein ILYODFUR_028777 [Ilyodon furcidens]|uniref:Uncharacterized protein n=1 Tax=Ilyodon furcidens TaxID=33524 RepID=A0ABV0UJT8_9TELE
MVILEELQRFTSPVGKFDAVQEERQRAKEKNENEVESTSCVNEDMPVEKILEAEEAVEPKTETYIETNLGMSSNSTPPPAPPGGAQGVPRPAKRHSPYSVSWDVSWASSQWGCLEHLPRKASRRHPV